MIFVNFDPLRWKMILLTKRKKSKLFLYFWNSEEIKALLMDSGLLPADIKEETVGLYMVFGFVVWILTMLFEDEYCSDVFG